MTHTFCFSDVFAVAGGGDVVLRRVPGDGGRDDGWGAHLIHPLPDEPGIHVLGEYLGEMMGGELISFILYQMNLGFMFSVSTYEMTGGELISFILYQMNLGFMFSVSIWER